MGKAFSLFRASLSEGMNFFRISGRNRSTFMKIWVPIIISVLFMLAMGSYGELMMEPLEGTGLEYVVLTIFVVFAAAFTLFEGVYKASGLLFNCRDDDMVLALPIKKSTVLLIRILKFYLFEVMVNALFLVPVMLVYALRVGVSGSFYLVSIVALLILPILPVVLSCLIGGIISFFSSKFKFKNLAQIIFTVLFLLVVLYVSYNLREFLTSFAQNAEGINAILVKFYYPVLQYINLVLSFNFLDLIVFIVANFGILLLTVLILGRVYYAINSRVKVIKTDVKKREYSIRTSRLTVALVKKEIGRFASSPVFVINAGFGLVLYALVCILLCLNMEGWLGQISEVGIEGLSAEKIMNFLPAIVFGLIFVTSMMTSITSSMISLEGKSFNVLKSLPVSAMRIILGKIYAAMVVMVPIILVGDIALFIRFDFSIWQMLMILVASIVMPMIAELVGIIVNLKFPKMDAEDDVEVVKQSMSSMIAVFIGMGAAAIMVALLYGVFMIGMSASDIMIIGTVVCLVILGLLLLYLKKRGEKEFNAINV